MKTSKRLLAFVLALCTAFSMTIPALAAEEDLTEKVISDVELVVGANELALDPTAVTTIYQFTPDEAGEYTFTADDENAKVGYWGGNKWFTFDATEEKTNTLTQSITAVGQTIMVGISGVESCTLTIEKAGEAVSTEIKYTTYVNTHEINVADGVEDEIVEGVDGFYHLNSADGDLLVVNFNGSVSIQDMLANGAARYVEKDEDGNVVVAYDYTDALTTYSDASVYSFYPLTADLVQMLQHLYVSKGWSSWSDSTEEDAWMFLCHKATTSHTAGNTEVEDGISVVYCADCGVVMSREAEHVHTLEHHEAVAATCINNGMQEYWYCAGCDCFFTDAEGKYNTAYLSLVIPADGTAHVLEHFDEVPACHTDGMQEHWYCSECDCYFTDAEGKYNIARLSLVIPADRELEHHEAVEAGCHTYGMQEYWSCDGCQMVFYDAEGRYNANMRSLVLLPENTLEHHEAVEAGCHTNGMQEYWYCAGCDCYFTDAEGKYNTARLSLVIPAEYTLEHHEAVAATCVNNGMQEYWYCAGCDCYFTDAEGKYNIARLSLVVPADGVSHVLEHHAGVDPVCHKTGMKEYWYCSECDCYFTDAEGKYNIARLSLVIPAVNELEHHEAVAATCFADGMQEYWYCDDCDCYFTDAEGKYNIARLSLMIPALECPSSAFADLKADLNVNSWWHEATDYVISKGLMVGSNGNWDRKGEVTRAMVVQILYRLAGEPEVTGTEDFTDVDNQWYAKVVTWAANNDIVTGYTDGTFQANKSVTREEMVTMFARFAKFMGMDITGDADLSKFSDAKDVHDYAEPAMKWAVAVGLVAGNEDGTLAPRAGATRQEMATIVMRWCEEIAK